MFQALYQLLGALRPFLEVVFLGFFLGIGLQSSATGIVAAIFLLVTNYFWPKIVLPIAWVPAIYLCLQLSTDHFLLSNLLIALAFGGIRFYFAYIQSQD